MQGDLQDGVATHGQFEWAELEDELAIVDEVGTLIVEPVTQVGGDEGVAGA